MVRQDLKFLFDVGVGQNVELWFQENGYDVKSIRNIDPRLDDKVILKMAVKERRLVVTMDKDFGNLVFHSGLPHAGVLLLRLEDADAITKIEIVKSIINKHSDKLYGKFSVYQRGRLRIRE